MRKQRWFMSLQDMKRLNKTDSSTSSTRKKIVSICFLGLYLVAYLPSYHEKAINALQRARLGIAGHLSTTPRWGESR